MVRAPLVCYVAQAKSGRELWAGHNIRNQGHQYYLPQVYNPKLKAPRPLFPGYIFPITTGPWHFLRGTFGIMSLVMNGEKPAMLPMCEIEKLRALENKHGHVTLPSHQFQPDQLVRIRAGRMAGYVGLYQGQSSADCVRVLIEALGQKVPVLVSEGMLEAA